MSPDTRPPDPFRSSPEMVTLAVDTILFRVHRSCFAPCQFNPNPPADPWQGGRFDSGVDDPYGFLYAGSNEQVAVAESLLRHVPSDSSSARILPRAQLVNRMISGIRTTQDLRLVKLHGSGLHAIDQDDGWLTATDAHNYMKTRFWGYAIRSCTPLAQGFVWRSKRFNDGFAYIFFDDRCPAGTFAAEGSLELDNGSGLAQVRSILHTLHCTVDSI